jgi:hypothetical protein
MNAQQALQTEQTMEHVTTRQGLERWISQGAPVFWVLGISMLFVAGALRGLSAWFVYLEWRIPALVTQWAVGLLVVSFLGCGIWFVFDALTADRPTVWRK